MSESGPVTRERSDRHNINMKRTLRLLWPQSGWIRTGLVALILAIIAISINSNAVEVDEKTVLLFHSGSVDGSPIVTDSSDKQNTIAVMGDVHHTTDKSEFYGSSILFDGFGDSLRVFESSDWDFGNWDFTIDLWVNVSNLDDGRYYLLTHTSGVNPENQGYSLEINDRVPVFNYVAGGAVFQGALTGITPLDDGLWHHIAVVRSGDNGLLFVDGVAEATHAFTGRSIDSVAGPLAVGEWVGLDQNYFHGYIDELMVSKGIARWETDFFLPAHAYQKSLYSLKATISASKIEENLTDFPVMMRLSSNSGEYSFDASAVFQELSFENRKKLDIRTSDGTPCFVEIESWDSDAGEAVLWVRVPEVSSTTDTGLIVYYDKSMPDNTKYTGDVGDVAAQNVWDAYYMGVYHFSSFAGNVLDSTKRLNHGTAYDFSEEDRAYNSPLGNAFNISNRHIELPDNEDFKPDNVSVEAFVSVNSYLEVGWASIFNRANDYTLFIDAGGRFGFGTMMMSGEEGLYGAAAMTYYEMGLWHYVVGSYEAGSTKMYNDGLLHDEVTTANDVIHYEENQTPTIGSEYGYVDKIISELRVSDRERSHAWVKATHASMGDTLLRYQSGALFMPPAEVGDALTVGIIEDSTTVFLDWTEYDTSGQDISVYLIYVETEAMTDLTALQPYAIVGADETEYWVDYLPSGLYYFAVVAVNSAGEKLDHVTQVKSVQVTDTVPPDEVQGLSVIESNEDRLVVSWDMGEYGYGGDLAGFKVFCNGITKDIKVSLSEGTERYTCEFTDLSPATSYTIVVKTYDTSNNESEGVMIEGATLLENPEVNTPVSEHGRIDLSWNPPFPWGLVDHYNIYKSESPFSNVEGMTPVATTTSTSTSVFCPDTAKTYFFAVTAVNISNGEKKEVTPVSATPLFATFVSGHITQNTTWTLANSPYVVTGDIIVRANDPGYYNFVTLKIEPGVEVRFNPGTGLYVGQHNYNTYYGALSATGSEDLPIVFTSNTCSPAPGDWKGINFRYPASSPDTRLDYCVIEYGGQYYYYNAYDNSNANIEFGSGAPAINHCTIRHSGGHGIKLKGASPTITNSEISDSAQCGLHLSGASSPIIGGERKGNAIRRSGTYAIFSADTGPLPDVSYNTISDYGASAMRMGSQMNVHNNTYSGAGDRIIEVLGGHITGNTTWSNEIPVYRVYGDVTVRHSTRIINSEPMKPVAVLTIRPGIEIRFEPGTGFYIGAEYPNDTQYGYYGALKAQGTDASQITFTSNASDSVPGQWKGINFRYPTLNDSTLIERCTIQYAVDGVYLNNAKPVSLQYNTFQNNSNSGIYINGTGCNAVNINCNNLKDNPYGVYVMNNAVPVITGNNFVTNPTRGLYSESTSQINATGNWWNNPGGPTAQGADTVYGNVDYASWLDSISTCINTPPINTAPYAPVNPEPADQAVKVQVMVSGQPVAVFLNWTGEDPNPWDEVTYSLYMGKTPDNLELTAEGITDSNYLKTGLEESTTYYWKVIVKDGAGEETPGPVWRFTTDGELSDLIVKTITTDPSDAIDLEQTIIIRAVIENNSANAQGPTVGMFRVSCKVDGQDIGYTDVNQIIMIGGTVTVEFPWVTSLGAHTIEVIADSNGNTVKETVEDNNSKTFELFEIVDLSPGLVAYYKMDTAVDGDAIDESGANTGSIQGAIGIVDGYIDDSMRFNGTDSWIEADSLVDAFADGETMTMSCWFKTTAAPAYSYGNILMALNGASKNNILRIGTGYNGGIFYDIAGNNPRVYGSGWNDGKWHFLVVSQKGTGEFKIFVDNNVVYSGTQVTPHWSDAVYCNIGQNWNSGSPSCFFNGDLDDLKIFKSILSSQEMTGMYVDREAPELVRTVPVDNSSVNNLPTIQFTLHDRHGHVNGTSVAGTIVLYEGEVEIPMFEVPVTTEIVGDTFILTPVSPLAQGSYHVNFTAADTAGNLKDYSFYFTLDSEAPTMPTITGGTVLSGTLKITPDLNRSNTTLVTITGTREANCSIWINNAMAVSAGQGDWSRSVNLQQGNNSVSVYQVDPAGNNSEPANINIFVDSIAPVPGVMTPVDNSYLSYSPASVELTFTDASTISHETSIFSLTDSLNAPVLGAWSVEDGNRIVFLPTQQLTDSAYTLTVQLEDSFQNKRNINAYHFTVDTEAPAAPVVNPVTSPTFLYYQVISGTREPYAEVLMNGTVVVARSASTSWQYTANLNSGLNTFTFSVRDRAGNQSDDVSVDIQYDDIPPTIVNTLIASNSGSGTEINLNWSGYNESGQGDIASYRVYVESTDFGNDVTNLTYLTTVTAGTFHYTIDNLEKNKTYYLAVTAIDLFGNVSDTVNASVVTTQDTMPPGNVSGITVSCTETALAYTWIHSANSDLDLAGYRIIIDGEDHGMIPGTTNTYTVSGLALASKHTFVVKAVDNDGNESSGTPLDGITLLPNPVNVHAIGQSGFVKLTWDSVGFSDYFKTYNVYCQADSDFTSTQSMTPVLTVSATSAMVTGLQNGRTYYFAVTSVNKSGGEQKTVTAVSTSPELDDVGPVLSNIHINGEVLGNGYILMKNSAITLNADDSSSVGRVVFYLDGQVTSTDFEGSPEYKYEIDINGMMDGEHTLNIEGFDMAGNKTSVQYVIQVNHPPAFMCIQQCI